MRLWEHEKLDGYAFFGGSENTWESLGYRLGNTLKQLGLPKEFEFIESGGHKSFIGKWKEPKAML